MFLCSLSTSSESFSVLSDDNEGFPSHQVPPANRLLFLSTAVASDNGDTDASSSVACSHIIFTSLFVHCCKRARFTSSRCEGLCLHRSEGVCVMSLMVVKQNAYCKYTTSCPEQSSLGLEIEHSDQLSRRATQMELLAVYVWDQTKIYINTMTTRWYRSQSKCKGCYCMRGNI